MLKDRKLQIYPPSLVWRPCWGPRRISGWNLPPQN